ncbi:MAG: hypothetical protein AMJ92_05920 [candidate division Zixibacteria bacterium SM23_81]|nr:MAG: hypothetical protein AMJ92_05920 [candidate division Zixibacteria bacterium SM23_81]
MVKKTTFLILFIFALVPPTALSAPHSEAGKAGLAFLKMGIGARAVGMGEAFVSMADDATALYWNPAGICQLQGGHLTLMHAEWFQDVRLEYLGAALGRESSAYGFSFTFNTAGEIERRVKASHQPLGTFSAHDMALSLSYARKMSPRWNLGLSLKALYEKIYLDDAWGWALDLGFLYKPPVEGLAVGGSILTLGPKMKLRHENFSLPTIYKLGLNYSPAPFHFKSGNLILAMDLSKPTDNQPRINWGGELRLMDRIALRSGYQLGYDEKGFSSGIGIYQQRFRLDYAFVPYSSDLGETHRISLGIEL